MSVPSTLAVHRSTRRRTALALLAPLTAAVVVAGATPASATVTEGDPGPTQCLRLVRLPGAAPAGSSLFVSHGYALVLREGADC
jgi:hypothetical protein